MVARCLLALVMPAAKTVVIVVLDEKCVVSLYVSESLLKTCMREQVLLVVVRGPAPPRAGIEEHQACDPVFPSSIG